MNPSTWQLNPDPFTSAKGAKSCAILNKDGAKISFEMGTCEEPLFTPFGAQCWQDNPSSRKSLEIDATPRVSATIKAIETVLKQQLVANSQKIFGKALTVDKVEDLWHSPMQQKNPDYPPRVRLKISPSTSLWDGVTKTALPPDTDLRGASIVVKVTPVGVWLMSRESGLTLLCQHILVYPAASASCPWG